MTSTILINVTSLLLAFDCVSLAFIVWQGRKFLRKTPRITSAEEFFAYRELVATCMKATMGFIVMFGLACLISFVGVSAGWIRLPDLESVMVMGIIRIFGGAVFSIDVEGRLKSIPTVGLQWELLKNRIVELWDAEPWPKKIYSVGADLDLLNTNDEELLALVIESES